MWEREFKKNILMILDLIVGIIGVVIVLVVFYSLENIIPSRDFRNCISGGLIGLILVIYDKFVISKLGLKRTIPMISDFIILIISAAIAVVVFYSLENIIPSRVFRASIMAGVMGIFNIIFHSLKDYWNRTHLGNNSK
jgi:hypothetical protein